jgi:predicted lipoprotein with Yx(FWY)xxD motif
MKTSKIVFWIIVVVIVLGGWYLLSSRATQPKILPSPYVGLNGSENQTNTGQKSVSPVVTVSSDAKLGSYLVASSGMTLYVYTKDGANVSNCYGACATNWPPYSPAGNEPLVAGNGIAGLLSTITRTDGSTQLTYKGAPLYFFKNDLKPGDVKGQNIGNVWFVVKP